MVEKTRHQIDATEVIRLLAVGSRQCEVARLLGVDIRKLQRFIQRDQRRIFDEVERYRSDMLAASAGKLAAAMGKAIDALQELLNSKSEKIRLSSARSVVDCCIRVNELARLEQRLTLLEQSLRSSGTKGNLT